MMRQRRFRAWVVLWAVLQFALPTFATYADVVLERESATAFAHAESRTDSSCSAVHSAECALCQVVNRSAAPERAVELPPCTHEILAPNEQFASQGRSAELSGQPESRAPPAV